MYVKKRPIDILLLQHSVNQRVVVLLQNYWWKRLDVTKKVVYLRRKRIVLRYSLLRHYPGLDIDAEISGKPEQFRSNNLLNNDRMTTIRTRQVLTSLSQLETSADTTFIVQDTVRAVLGVKSISIASGVSLVFDGGMIAGALVTLNNRQLEQSLELVGNFTSVEAPITQIFGDTVTASGYWHIDRAYPQWFDAVAGSQSYYTDNPHDCSVAINKAVEMKMSGEVFLPAGVYLVSHTVRLRHGINLIGDSATRTKISEENASDSDMVNKWGRASFIVPWFWKYTDKITGKDVTVPPVFSEYSIDGVVRPVMVAVNTEDAPSAKAHIPVAHPNGSIDHIYFINVNKDMMKEDSAAAEHCANIAWNAVCCLVAGGFTFRHVVWENFCRAIKWTREYNDAKTIYRCIVQTDFKDEVLKNILDKIKETEESEEPEEMPYLIDMTGLGDAAIIEGNHIDRGVYKEPGNKFVGTRKEYQLYKSLSLRDCFGGTIRANIIHSDIDIKHCTALEFADNHCELGMQMNIRWSSMRICNNYLEKGRVPNIVIHAMEGASEGNGTFGDVELSGNKFVCYNTEGRTLISEVCEYDMLLKTRKGVAPYNIEMGRNSRVTVNNDGLSMQPTGIMLATQNTDKDGVEEDVQQFKAFNDHSYFLSDRASIRRNLKLKQLNTVSSVPALTIDAMNNTNIPKLPNDNQLATATTYKFYFQAIADEPRAIASAVGLMSVNPSTDVLNYSSGGTQCGILFALHWRGDVESCSVRIVRDTILNGKHIKRHVVTVPVCGARFLHDNFTSVEGHLWVSVPIEKIGDKYVTDTDLDMNKIPEFITQPNSGIEAVQFIDDNVSCSASATPAAGEWKSGDTIVFKPSGGSSEQEWRDATVRIKN